MGKYLGLTNYYGSVEVNEKQDGTFTMGLENYDGYYEVVISKELYELLISELYEQEDTVVKKEWTVRPPDGYFR